MRINSRSFFLLAQALTAMTWPLHATDLCTVPTEIQLGFDPSTHESPLYAPEVIKADLESWIEQSMNTHPKFDMATDLGELSTVRDNILSKIDRPMNELEVFRLFSRVNSVLNDGHHGIAFSGRNQKIETAIEAGDRLFPIHVHIDDTYRVFARKPYQTIETGTEIVAINGVSASIIAHTLEERSHGDTPKLRRSLVADRFAELIWQHFGTSKDFHVLLKDGEDCSSRTISGATAIMAHRQNIPDFEPRFSFEILADGSTAYLKLGSFYLPQGTDQWDAFTQQVFEQINQSDIEHLIIDIRENGGGDDTLWIESIMPYVTNKPWQRMANFLGRVGTNDEDFPGRSGEVALFDYQGKFPAKEDANFGGQIYVVTGDLTYSSAIMFATAVQDNQLGKIVGAPTQARSCSTGMSQYHELQVGGMVAFTPTHWYQRSDGGQSCMAGVQPDIMLDDDPYDPNQIIEALVSLIESEN